MKNTDATDQKRNGWIHILVGKFGNEFMRIGTHPKIKAKDGLYFHPESFAISQTPSEFRVIDRRPATKSDPKFAACYWAYDDEALNRLPFFSPDATDVCSVKRGLPDVELPKGYRPRDFTTGLTVSFLF